MPTKLIELSYTINLFLPIVLVLEPNENEDEWTWIFNRSSELIGSLPGRINQIYFLGSRDSYGIATQQEFNENAPGWYHKNKGKVNLIRPIFSKLEIEKFIGRIVIFCSSIPLDLDDWYDTDLLNRTIFISKDNGNNLIEVINPAIRVNDIINFLNNEIEKIEIKGEGFIPVSFQILPEDSIEIEWENDNFKVSLSNIENVSNLTIQALAKKEPKIFIKRKWDTQIISPSRIENIEIEPEWNDLPNNLISIISAGLNKSEYDCPQCGEKHKFNMFVCPQGDLILRDIPTNTCIIFTKDLKYFVLSSLFAFPINEKIVITKNGQLLKLVNEKWVKSDLTPYEEIQGGLYALYHKI